MSLVGTAHVAQICFPGHVMLLKIAQAESGVYGGMDLGFNAQVHHFFGKPEIRLLVAQGHVRIGDGDHPFGLKAFPYADLDLQGELGTLPEFSVQHFLFFPVQDHVSLPVTYLTCAQSLGSEN
jgi:hypothetical protein